MGGCSASNCTNLRRVELELTENTLDEAAHHRLPVVINANIDRAWGTSDVPPFRDSDAVPGDEAIERCGVVNGHP